MRLPALRRPLIRPERPMAWRKRSNRNHLDCNQQRASRAGRSATQAAYLRRSDWRRRRPRLRTSVPSAIRSGWPFDSLKTNGRTSRTGSRPRASQKPCPWHRRRLDRPQSLRRCPRWGDRRAPTLPRFLPAPFQRTRFLRTRFLRARFLRTKPSCPPHRWARSPGCRPHRENCHTRRRATPRQERRPMNQELDATLRIFGRRRVERD